jgi:hypothetical protein
VVRESRRIVLGGFKGAIVGDEVSQTLFLIDTPGTDTAFTPSAASQYMHQQNQAAGRFLRRAGKGPLNLELLMFQPEDEISGWEVVEGSVVDGLQEYRELV